MKKILLMSLFLLSASGILFAKKTEKGSKQTKGIHQVILINFKDSVTEKNKDDIDKFVQLLKEKSKTVQEMDWGKPLEVTGNNSENFDFCITIKFKNDTNYEIFQQNPLRMEFMGTLIPLTDNIITYTYQITE